MPCITCSAEPTVDRCRRCSGRLCLEHTPSGDRRCERCEQQFRERRAGAGLRWWFLAFFLGVWPIFFVLADDVREKYGDRAGGMRTFTTGFPLLDFFFMMVLAGFIAGGTAVHLRKWFLRRRFLAESTDES